MARLTVIDPDDETYETDSPKITTDVQGMFLVEVSFPYYVWPSDVRGNVQAVVGWDAVVTDGSETYSGIVNEAEGTGLTIEVNHT